MRNAGEAVDTLAPRPPEKVSSVERLLTTSGLGRQTVGLLIEAALHTNRSHALQADLRELAVGTKTQLFLLASKHHIDYPDSLKPGWRPRRVPGFLERRLKGISRKVGGKTSAALLLGFSAAMLSGLAIVARVSMAYVETTPSVLNKSIFAFYNAVATGAVASLEIPIARELLRLSGRNPRPISTAIGNHRNGGKCDGCRRRSESKSNGSCALRFAPPIAH